ncbi:hypothetical protein [Kribbella endophytica]
MPKSTRKRSTGRVSGRRGSATSAVETITRPSQSLPVIILLSIWRWRWELITLATVAYIVHTHGAAITSYFDSNPVWLNALLVIVLSGWIFTDNLVRRFARNRVWCVITRHRVRPASPKCAP